MYSMLQLLFAVIYYLRIVFDVGFFGLHSYFESFRWLYATPYNQFPLLYLSGFVSCYLLTRIDLTLSGVFLFLVYVFSVWPVLVPIYYDQNSMVERTALTLIFHLFCLGLFSLGYFYF